MLALSILTRGNSGTIALQGPCPRGGEELMSFDWHTTPPLHVTVATMRQGPDSNGETRTKARRQRWGVGTMLTPQFAAEGMDFWALPDGPILAHSKPV